MDKDRDAPASTVAGQQTGPGHPSKSGSHSLSPRRGIPEAELDPMDHPAGALLPQQAHHRGKGKTSVAIDLTKLLKSRTKPQVRDNKPPGSNGVGSGTTLPSAENGGLAAPAITPKPVRKKRGRPPKAVAKAVVDNLNSPSDSLPIAALAGDYAFRQDAPNSIEEEDHDQAILDAAAVLTSSLPYPQEIAVRPSPMAKQGRRAKGKRRSSNSSADAPQPAAAHKRPRGRSQGTSQQWHPTRDKQLGGVGQMAREPEQERHRPPVREQQNQGERQQDREGEQSQERSRRRQLEDDLLEPSVALDGVSGGRHDRAATKAQRPSTSSASPPAAAKLAAGSSVGHQQEASTKKGSSDSEPALTQTTSRDADRGRTEARVETPPRPSRSQHLQEQLRDLRPTEPVQTQQAQHEAQHSVQQAAQPAFQPPVLALLISGIPPIVLGTFQGDMQRARIILEAAGFLLPVDLSSSLLPPNLNSSPPLQRAAAPAVHALPAGLQTAQAAVQGGVYTSGEDEEEGLPVRHAAVGGVEQAVTEGASLRGAHRRKQTRPGEQPARGSKPLSPAVHQDAGRPVVRPGNNRGRPSNLARQAAAAAAAAAAQLRDGDQVSPSRSQNGNSAADRDGLSQEEWERMGFHGELQGTGQNGQNGLDQDGDAPDEAGHASGPGMKRSRRPSARILQAHDIPSEEQQVAFEGHSPEGRQGRGRGRLGKRGRGSLHHMGSPRSRDGSQLPTNHARFDHPQALPLADATTDHGDPHIPRRKRSKPTELLRPLELLAAANAAAARAAAGGRQDDHEDDYMPDNLSCLAAAAAAESESDAELARAPENSQQDTRQEQRRMTTAQQQRYQASTAIWQDAHAEAAAAPAGPTSSASGALLGPGHVGGEALVGRLVAKRFGSHPVFFPGRVNYFAPMLCPQAPFRIQYEDGDSEDLNREQVEAILV
ncbi:hypothetical protein WJX79_003856 [Trebouxia sp. C0005]